MTHHTQGGTDCRSKIRGRVKPRVKINPFIPLFIVFSSPFAARVHSHFLTHTSVRRRLLTKTGVKVRLKLAFKCQAVSGADARFCKKTGACVMLMAARCLAGSRTAAIT